MKIEYTLTAKEVFINSVIIVLQYKFKYEDAGYKDARFSHFETIMFPLKGLVRAGSVMNLISSSSEVK